MSYFNKIKKLGFKNCSSGLALLPICFICIQICLNPSSAFSQTLASPVSSGGSTLIIPNRQYGVPLPTATNTGQPQQQLQQLQQQQVQSMGQLQGNVIYNTSPESNYPDPQTAQQNGFQYNNSSPSINGLGQSEFPSNSLPTTDPNKLEFNKLTLTTPSDSKGYFERGLAKYRLKDYTGALDDMNKAIELDSSYGQAYLYRGRCKKALKDKSGAVADFQKSLELNPDSANYYLRSGWTKVLIKDFNGALADFDKAISLKSDFPEAFIKRGETKNLMGDYSSAIRDFNQALVFDSNNADAHRRRAFANFKLKNYTQAMQDNETAKELFQKQGNFEGYKSSVDSINTLREIMRKEKD